MEKKTRINSLLERQVVKGAEYPSAANQVQGAKRFYRHWPGPPGFKNIHGPAPSGAVAMHFDQLCLLRSLAHEKEHSILAPVEYENLSLPDTDRIFLNGIDHLIRTHASIVFARLTPALRRDRRSWYVGR